jgi:hypothetical protein
MRMPTAFDYELEGKWTVQVQRIISVLNFGPCVSRRRLTASILDSPESGSASNLPALQD